MIFVSAHVRDRRTEFVSLNNISRYLKNDALLFYSLKVLLHHTCIYILYVFVVGFILVTMYFE